MNPFTTLHSRVALLPIDNIDTDQIIPARFLKVIDKNGLADCLFADWRTSPDFVLNQPATTGAEILLAGENFGCGSSREHAPWALLAFGFRAVIAKSFADIFKNNALQNGLLPVIAPGELHQALLQRCKDDPQTTISIDLAAQTAAVKDGPEGSFPMDPFAKQRLLRGMDQLGYLLSMKDRIADYESLNLSQEQE